MATPYNSSRGKLARYWQGFANGILYGLAAAFVLPRLFRITQQPGLPPSGEHPRTLIR